VQRFHQRSIRLAEWQARQLAQWYFSQELSGQRHWCPANDTSFVDVQVHLDVGVRVACLEAVAANLQRDTEFLVCLAQKGCGIRLTCFDFAAWELPEKPALLPRWPLLYENPPPRVAGDEGCYHPQPARGRGHPEPLGRFISRE
jgi:hypothetical protein